MRYNENLGTFDFQKERIKSIKSKLSKRTDLGDFVYVLELSAFKIKLNNSIKNQSLDGYTILQNEKISINSNDQYLTLYLRKEPYGLYVGETINPFKRFYEHKYKEIEIKNNIAYVKTSAALHPHYIKI